MRILILLITLYSSWVWARPTDLGLVWNASPSPHGDYAYCEKAKAGTDFCLQHGQWLGYCADGPDTLKWGHMRIENGKVNFSGCKKYRFLIVRSVAKKNRFTDKAALSTAACSSDNSFVTAIADKLFCVRLEGNRKLRFASRDYPKTVNGIPQEQLCGMAASICQRGKTVPLPDITDFGKSEPWSIEMVEDLNGDRFPEVLLSRSVNKTSTTDQAVLVDTKNPAKAAAQTMTKASLNLNRSGAKIGG